MLKRLEGLEAGGLLRRWPSARRILGGLEFHLADINFENVEAPKKFSVFRLSEALPVVGETCVVVSKLVTAPERRGSKTLGPVMRAVLDYVSRNGHRYIAILAEPTMREFYGSMGFDIRADGIDAPPFGKVALMVFDMQDERHTSGKSLAGWMFKSVFSR